MTGNELIEQLAQHMDGRGLIEHLAVPHRRTAAMRALFAMEYDAVPFALEGLRHESDAARAGCCQVLDHFLVPEALPVLMESLDDPSPRVRVMALHTLACDRCKQGGWRPTEEQVLPKALTLLRKDSSPSARAMAIEVVGNFVHCSDEAESALIDARSNDPSPAVRKKAGWYAPGGTIHKRTAPRVDA